VTSRPLANAPLPDSGSAPAGRLKGVRATQVAGWVLPVLPGRQPARVDIFLDGSFLGTCVADMPHGPADARPAPTGFRTTLPAGCLDGGEHEIRAFRREDGCELDGSPLAVRLGSRPAPAPGGQPPETPETPPRPEGPPREERPDPRDPGQDMPAPEHRAVPEAARPFLRAVDACSGRLVVVYPIIAWDFRWQRPQQIVSRLAQAGYTALHLAHAPAGELPADPAEALAALDMTPLAEGVFGCRLSTAGRFSIYQNPLDGLTLEAMAMGLSSLLDKADPQDLIHLVHFPGWQPLAARMAECHGGRVVYDCMDHHAGFSTNTPDVLASEQRLIAEADLVIASSLLLEKELRPRARDVLLAKNATHYEHFADATGNGELERFSGGPVIGYIGAIADWFDIELLEHCAQARPHWNFVLIGSTAFCDVTRAQAMENVHFLGETPFSALPGYLASFDVCTIPFRVTPLTEATNPVKFYEYMSAGKPVVSTPLPELEPYAGHALLAASPEEFLACLERALAESRIPALAEQRRALARSNDWAHRVRDILEHPVFARHRTPRGRYRASIILVTFNELEEATRDCIRSILANTPPGRYELIVVDNLSTRDDTRPYLRQLEREHPHVRVKLNPRNKGYAGANNDGLRMAAGDFLVLLNNDTLTPPGWLDALLEPFDLGDDVGLVGPVTNACGNVQCIDIPGITPDNYESLASEYVAANRGMTFEVSRLGFFCVAARRELVESLGPLDERYGLGMFEDDDYCIRAVRGGWRCLVTEGSFVYHKGGASFGKLDAPTYQGLFEANRARLEQAHGVRWSFADIARDYLDKLSTDLHIAASGFDPAGASLGRMERRMEGLRHILGHLRGLELENRRPPDRQPDAASQRPVGYDHNSLIARFGWFRRGHFTGRAVVMPVAGSSWLEAERSRHLARAFARLGYTVIRAALSHRGEAVRALRRAGDNLFLVNPEHTPYLAHALRPEEAACVIFRPDDGRLRRRVPHCCLVYDVSADPDAPASGGQAARARHEQCLREADLLTVSADLLAGRIPGEHAGKVLMARAAVDDDLFEALEKPGPAAPELEALRDGPVIGCLGIPARWVDFALLEHAARELPHCRFVLAVPAVGAEPASARPSRTPPNLTLLPHPPRERLAGFLRGLDAAMLPCALDAFTRALAPSMLFECMAAGKPVVATAMPECARVGEVLTAVDADAFVDQLRRALQQSGDPAHGALLRQRAGRNTWNRRAIEAAARFPDSLRPDPF